MKTMESQAVLSRLSDAREELGRMGVESLMLFGSTARGDAAPTSDVDLLVEFSRPVGLFEFARIRLRLEEILGRRVDLATRGALRPEMREQILREAIRAA